MLAAAVSLHPQSLVELARHERRHEVKRALRWLRERFTSETSAEARRVEAQFEREYGQSGGAAWAVAAVGSLFTALDQQS